MGWTDRLQLRGTGWTELGEHSGVSAPRKAQAEQGRDGTKREKGGSGAKTGSEQRKIKNQVKYQAAFPH